MREHNRCVASVSDRPRGAVRRPAAFWLGVFAAACFAALLVHLGSGASDGSFFSFRLSPMEVLRELARGDVGADSQNSIVWRIRLPRALACVLAGGILGIVGSAFQALFRNPLAEPYIVGVSSGAAVGGAVAIALGIADLGAGIGMMGFAFVFGLGSLALVFGLASRRGVVDVQTLLLAGVVVGSMLAATLALVLLAAGLDTNQVLRWLLGSTTPMYWNRLAAMGSVLVVGGIVLALQTKRLNAFAVGEDTAQRLGVDTKTLKWTVLIAGTAMTAAAVGSVGIIGFLGLVAPHLARQLIGVDWRWSLIGSALSGACLLLLADVVAQRALPGGELPVGIVTALLGAPALLFLLRRVPAA